MYYFQKKKTTFYLLHEIKILCFVVFNNKIDKYIYIIYILLL